MNTDKLRPLTFSVTTGYKVILRYVNDLLAKIYNKAMRKKHIHKNVIICKSWIFTLFSSKTLNVNLSLNQWKNQIPFLLHPFLFAMNLIPFYYCSCLDFSLILWLFSATFYLKYPTMNSGQIYAQRPWIWPPRVDNILNCNFNKLMPGKCLWFWKQKCLIIFMLHIIMIIEMIPPIFFNVFQNVSLISWHHQLTYHGLLMPIIALCYH